MTRKMKTDIRSLTNTPCPLLKRTKATDVAMPPHITHVPLRTILSERLLPLARGVYRRFSGTLLEALGDSMTLCYDPSVHFYSFVSARKRSFSAVAAFYLRIFLCGVKDYASAQVYDFIVTTKNCSRPDQKRALCHP